LVGVVVEEVEAALDDVDGGAAVDVPVEDGVAAVVEEVVADVGAGSVLSAAGVAAGSPPEGGFSLSE
jgi:hypothetical protein